MPLLEDILLFKASGGFLSNRLAELMLLERFGDFAGTFFLGWVTVRPVLVWIGCPAIRGSGFTSLGGEDRIYLLAVILGLFCANIDFLSFEASESLGVESSDFDGNVESSSLHSLFILLDLFLGGLLVSPADLGVKIFGFRLFLGLSNLNILVLCFICRGSECWSKLLEVLGLKCIFCKSVSFKIFLGVSSFDLIVDKLECSVSSSMRESSSANLEICASCAFGGKSSPGMFGISKKFLCSPKAKSFKTTTSSEAEKRKVSELFLSKEVISHLDS